MREVLGVVLLAALLPLGGENPVAAERAAFKVLFCPECWTHLWGDGALDMKGNCAECGRYPVELECRKASWWWCAGEEQWRDTPCARNEDARCCTQEESLAAVVAPGPEIRKTWYCPGHRAFRMIRLPVTRQVVCASCARPAVRTPGDHRTWFWCENEGLWAPDACPLNPGKQCCTKRAGTLLAWPDPGPIAR